MRQPLEEGCVRIARAARTAVFPARFMLIGAMNPCPCGYAGMEGRCQCPPLVPDRYVGRISGPLRDRIDVWVTLARMPAEAMVRGSEPESSSVVAGRIAAARARQLVRPGRRLNSRVSGRRLRAISDLSPEASERLTQLADTELLSGRGTERLLRVARTIGDLAGSAAVESEHLEEAARWRPLTARAHLALAV